MIGPVGFTTSGRLPLRFVGVASPEPGMARKNRPRGSAVGLLKAQAIAEVLVVGLPYVTRDHSQVRWNCTPLGSSWSMSSDLSSCNAHGASVRMSVAVPQPTRNARLVPPCNFLVASTASRETGRTRSREHRHDDRADNAHRHERAC